MFKRLKHVAALLAVTTCLQGATTKTWPGGSTNTTPTSFSIPSAGDQNWAALSNFLIALANSAQSTTFQKFAVRRATSTPVTVSATTDAIIVSAMSVASAVAVNLPSGATKQVFVIVDGTGDAATNNITITPASGNINGASTYVIDKNNGGIMTVYDGTQWTIIAEFNALSGSGSSTVLTKTNTVTGITNKTFTDASTSIADDGDSTKLVRFQASGITTGNTRTLTVPDASTTLVGHDATQTLTNKTMGSTNTLTGATATNFTNVGTISLPSSTDTLVGRNTTDTLTNKTMDNTNTVEFKDTLFTLQDDGDATKKGQFQLGSLTSGTALYTLPSGNTTIAGLSNTQTLSNKTLGNTNIATLRSDRFTLQDASDTTKQLSLDLSGISTTTTRTWALPDANSTFVGTGTTQTLTNKTLSGNTATNLISGSGTLTLNTSGTATVPNATDTLVGKATTDTFTNKTLTAPDITGGSYVNYLTQAAARYNDDSGGDYVAIKAPTGVTTHTLTLPAAQGGASTVLTNNGSGALSWSAAASASLNQYNTDVGNSSNTRTAVDTSLLGWTKGSSVSTTVTMTNATPSVVTHTSHGLVTGDVVYFTTSGVLPAGSASTRYYITKVDANSYKFSTTIANLLAETFVAATGAGSGTHTAVTGGLSYVSTEDKLPGTYTGNAASAGYLGEKISRTFSANTTISTGVGTVGNITHDGATAATIALSAGSWLIYYGATVSTIIPSTNDGGIKISVNNNTDASELTECTTMYLVTNNHTANQYFPMRGQCTLNIAAPKTLGLKWEGYEPSGSNSFTWYGAEIGAGFTGTDNTAYFYAVRIR